MIKINLYTDGACSGNPGPGGWCCIIVLGNQEKELSGFVEYTTNNQMELQSVLEGLKALQNTKESLDINLYSDSQYVVRTINEWLPGWIKSNFKGKKNVDMWKEYIELSQRHKITAIHVKAHAGHHYNERCDKIAYNLAQSKYKKSDYVDHQEILNNLINDKGNYKCNIDNDDIDMEKLFKELGI